MVIVEQLNKPKKPTKKRVYEFSMNKNGNSHTLLLCAYTLRELRGSKWVSVESWDIATQCISTIKAEDIPIPKKIMFMAMQELLAQTKISTPKGEICCTDL